MSRALALARQYGVAVSFADLGDWGFDELRSEYDAQHRAIRLNVRVAELLPADELGAFVAMTVGHELYHHREAIGEIAVLPDRRARELAANEYAQQLLRDRGA